MRELIVEKIKKEKNKDIIEITDIVVHALQRLYMQSLFAVNRAGVRSYPGESPNNSIKR